MLSSTLEKTPDINRNMGAERERAHSEMDFPEKMSKLIQNTLRGLLPSRGMERREDN